MNYKDLIKECKKRGLTISDDNGKFSLIDKEGKEHDVLNSEDMKLYQSGKEEVPNYFIEFLDGL